MSSDDVVLPATSRVSGGSREFDLGEVFHIFLRRRKIFFVCVSLVLLLAVAYLAVAKRKYRADAKIQLLTGTTPVNVAETSESPQDALALAVDMQTYVGILNSDRLALEVIQQLDLEHTADFGYADYGYRKGAASNTTEMSRPQSDKLLKIFQKNLSVSAISGSRLISVSYQATNLDLAQHILSTLLNDFTEYNFNTRYTASTESAKWLENQLDGLKKQVDEKQARASELQRETGIYGAESSSDVILARLQQLNQQVTNAEENRIVKQAIRDAVRAGGAEAISNLSGAGGQSSSGGPMNSLSLLQSLRQEQATLHARLAELTSKYGPNYPQVVEVTNQLTANDDQIRNETKRLASRADNDYRSALQQEDALRTEYQKQENLANETHNRSVDYLIANREANSARDLYETLVNKLEQTGVQAGLHDTNISVMDIARASATPSSPKVLVVLGGGLLAGIFLGLCAVFLIDAMDRTMHNPELVTEITSRPLLGIVPRAPKNFASLYEAAGDTPMTEDFRMVRTAVLRNAEEAGAKVLLVVSAAHREGRSVVASNLASVLAQQGSRTLLIDADLRERTLTDALGLREKPGLSDLRTTRLAVARLNGIDVIPAGIETSHPSELLSSREVIAFIAEQRASYDFVILDTPPLLSAADATVLAPCADAAILVCRAGVSQQTSVKRATHLLESNRIPILGTLFNAMDTTSAEYRYLYGDPNSGARNSKTRSFA